MRLTEKADLENMLAAFILYGVMVLEGCWDNAVAKCRERPRSFPKVRRLE